MINISSQSIIKNTSIISCEIGYYEFSEIREDPKLSGVDIMSVTKDAQTSGKWTVAIGLKGKDGKPYAPKPDYDYQIDATADFYALRTRGKPVHTDKFQFSLDTKSSL